MTNLYEYMHKKFKDGIYVAAPNIYHSDVKDNPIIPENYSAIAKYRLISYAISRQPLNNFSELFNTTTNDEQFDLEKYSDNRVMMK